MYLRGMTHLLETVRIWEDSEQFRYSEAANKVFQRCVDLEQSEDAAIEGSLSPRTHHVRQSTRLTALIYLLVCIREVPAAGVPYKVALRKVRSHLSKTNLEDIWNPEEQSHLLLWILSIAASTAVDEIERTWYGRWIRNVTTKLGLRSWDRVKEVLTGFVWMDSILDAKFVPIWDEFGAQEALSNALTQPWSQSSTHARFQVCP